MTDDNFFGSPPPDKTIIMPAPRAGAAPAQPAGNPLANPTASSGLGSAAKTPPVIDQGLTDRNIILGMTAPLLCFAAELRHAPQPPNDSQIYSTLVNDSNRRY